MHGLVLGAVDLGRGIDADAGVEPTARSIADPAVSEKFLGPFPFRNDRRSARVPSSYRER
jgi:hypothetical protein